MINELSIYVPEAAVWLLRLAVDPKLSRSLQRDPVAFATWYAAVGNAVAWPAEIVRIQESERSKRLSLDRMMKLLSQVNYALSSRTNAEHARLVLEGYAIHDWAGRNAQALIALASNALQGLATGGQPDRPPDDSSPPFAKRLFDLGRILNLSRLEQDILAFAFLTAVSSELHGIFDQAASDRWSTGALWRVIFDTTAASLANAMRPRSPLWLSGILRKAGRRARFATVSRFWVDLLGGSDSLAEALVEPLEVKAGSGRPARLAAEDFRLAVRLLRRANEPGVNLLLYGDASLEKRQLLQEIIVASRRSPWRVRRFEEAPDDALPSLTFVALQLLAARDDAPVLIIERPGEVLHTSPADWLRELFGVESSDEESRPFDANLLSTNPIPAIWLGDEAGSLPEDTVARFVFHAPLKKADRSARQRALRKRLGNLRLSDHCTAQILKLDGVSNAQLESAIKTSRLIAPRTRADREEAIVQAVRRSQRALARELNDSFKPSVTKYSLEYLNTAGRFGPAQILESFRRRAKGSVLLYGPPGTGKTQFVEYLAEELRMPLVSKAASALLSKWVGDSEKNIAAAFEEAAAEDAVLFFDEGDSFLRSRHRAFHSWEVTQTNELLQHMERFDGIVVVATNLFRDLDAAALRRFTFKVEFRELDLGQRWKMFVAESGLAPTIDRIDRPTLDGWEKRLLFMKQLTAGDFATVKRQCLAFDTSLTPDEWLEQLEIECAVKSSGSAAEPR